MPISVLQAIISIFVTLTQPNMLRTPRLFPLFFLLTSLSVMAQKKTVRTSFTDASISIDGTMEKVWETAEPATDFVMYQPDNGKLIAPEKKAIVRVLYNQEALYIFAELQDDQPDKILKEITQRDNIGVADMFGVFINGFNDGQQDFQFFVSASGVQMDRLATEDNEVAPDNFGQDFSWDAIWDSAVRLTSTGWNVEMKIPYAALRFSDAPIQTWGINFYRGIRRDRQHYTWNPIRFDEKLTRTQNGLLEGLQNLQPPTRLFFIPYTSFYHEQGPAGKDDRFKAGLDVKYGINESFTLDAILVPDFGQTKYDNLILNLSPYEQQFAENRPFFTEGTDLFSKGDLFYSRRIGAAPSFGYTTYDSATETLDQPATVNLLNAVKISGRTNRGLGIGVLNAVTEETHGTVTDIATGAKRSVIVEPLTNYNVLVLDQRFNQNSSVSLVNTNVTRDGSFYDANVSAFLFNLNTKKNTYNLSGDFKYSYIESDYQGFKTALNLEKTSGQYRWSLFGKYISNNYDINDLGYITQTNYHNAYADASYRILNPTKWFNTFRVDVRSSVELQNNTGKPQDAFFNMSAQGNSVVNDYYYALLQLNPIETFDFYMPRSTGRFSYVPKSALAQLIFSSNYNRPFALDVNVVGRKYDEERRLTYAWNFSPRYRVNDKLMLIYSFEYSRDLSDRGYVGNTDTDILYAERDIKTIVSQLSAKYALNNKMTLNLSARYYWSFSENRRLFTLGDDGYLDGTDFITGLDENFNVWNMDLNYSWWFAPGSQLSVLYRNNALDYTNIIRHRFNDNVRELFDDNLNNVFSVSVRYYIDYNSLRRRK